MTQTDKQAHTPGPWEYWDSYDGKGRDPVEACRHCGRTDTAFFTIPGGHGNGECAVYTKADARLISAAPDLLEALEAVERLMSLGWPYRVDLSIAERNTIKTAIAKAKPEAPFPVQIITWPTCPKCGRDTLVVPKSASEIIECTNCGVTGGRSN